MCWPATTACSDGRFTRRAGLGGRFNRVNAQGVNVCLHQVIQGVVDEPVGLERPEAGKFVGYDADPEMTFSVTCSGVPYMQMALVDDLKVNRLKCRIEAFADYPDAIFVQGNTNLKGFTATLW